VLTFSQFLDEKLKKTVYGKPMKTKKVRTAPILKSIGNFVSDALGFGKTPKLKKSLKPLPPKLTP
jgi:hypothetical protein